MEYISVDKMFCKLYCLHSTARTSCLIQPCRIFQTIWLTASSCAEVFFPPSPAAHCQMVIWFIETIKTPITISDSRLPRRGGGSCYFWGRSYVYV
uniref:Uncharacterized protein n=1 Tax=Physcomitrium patens TaxID=3218 RepID=A0A7I3ZYY1_PHYPA